ncbi:MAG: M20 family metallo-hydrolase, partial [Desulfobacteraceae bacterium]
EEVIRLQSELTSRVALGPENQGTGEHEKAEFVEQEIRRLEPDRLEEVRAPDERAAGGYRPNLVAWWRGSEAGPAVWVLSHLDIVPPGGLELWDGDPYRVRVEGERLYGRGVEDDQHAIVSSLLAVKAVRDAGEALKRTVGLAMVADEETGSRYGLGYLLEHRSGLFNREDLIVVPDGGNEQGTMIEVAEKGMLWLRFTVNGVQCHASTPQKGKNSLVGAARLILALSELERRFSAVDPLFSPPESTFAPTKIEANVPNVNTIPGRERFYLDCRVLPEYGLDQVIEAARGLASKAASETGLEIDVEVFHREDAAEPTPVDAPVVEGLKRAIKLVSGRDAEPKGIGGGTVAALFRKAGLPAAVWLTVQDTAHQPNEYCLIKDVLQDAKVFAALYQGGD